MKGSYIYRPLQGSKTEFEISSNNLKLMEKAFSLKGFFVCIIFLLTLHHERI